MSERPVERRVITALFVDVVGSTALTVQLGPERFKRALDQAFVELGEIITAEGGTLEKFIGDAIFALFGAPTAHADDAQRALRAAHACVQWSAAHGQAAVPLAVRVGLETGEAIVDLAATATERQQTSVGACVVLAARLQQIAEPGQVLVGPVCHDVTQGMGEFADLGEVELKGLGHQHVWRLTALAVSPTSTHLPFIGRDRELDLLLAAYRRAQSGVSVFVLISGPPGQGKTRLVEEFTARIGEQAQLLKARCRPAGELGTRNPLYEFLTSDGSEASPDDLRARLVQLFPDTLERHRVLAALAHSAGMLASQELTALPTGQRQDEIENGWRRYLTALARRGPVVMWAEDLHWAEAEIVDLLDRLTLGATTPVTVVATARPEFAAEAALRSGEKRLLITLGALDDRDAEALARNAGSIIDRTHIERAEGNPLFIVELARARQSDRGEALPITLKGIIGARLDELPAQDRELLQRVAIVGERFTARDAILLSGRKAADVLGTLQRHSDLAYLHPVPGGYRFHHALVRDVASARLSTAERMRLHAQFAKDGVPPGDSQALAYHLWEAVGPSDAEWVWEGSREFADLRSRALDAHLGSARRYADRLAYERAIDECKRAFRFAETPAETGRVEQGLGAILLAKGDADTAWEHYMLARDAYRNGGMAPPPDFYPSLLEPRVYTSGMFVRLPDETLVKALLEEGEDSVRRSGDKAALARLVALGAYRSHDAEKLLEALQLSAQSADSAALGSFLAHAAILQNRAGQFAVARGTYERLDAVAGPGVATDQQLEFRAILALNTGRVGEAEEFSNQYLAASASRGPHLQTHAHREHSHVLLAQGRWDALEALATETQALVARHPETSFCYAVTTVLALAAVAHALQGRGNEARALVQYARKPLQAEPLEREAVLLLANGVMGNRSEVDELRRTVHAADPQPFWFFTRMEAVVLTMLECWNELDQVMAPLDAIAAEGSLYVEALLAAVREEMAAASGGPAPCHAELRQLGYKGWSELLSFRPLQ